MSISMPNAELISRSLLVNSRHSCPWRVWQGGSGPHFWDRIPLLTFFFATLGSPKCPWNVPISLKRDQRRPEVTPKCPRSVPRSPKGDPRAPKSDGYRGLRNPRPSMFEDFDPPEATTAGHRGLTNPIPSIVEDFDPLEATTVCHRGLKIKAFDF